MDYMAGKTKKVEMLKNEVQNGVGIENGPQFFGPRDSPESVLSPNVTTFFLTYFLTLEYIMKTFQIQFTNIFRKNVRRGTKKVCFLPPPFPISKGLLTTYFFFHIVIFYKNDVMLLLKT